MAAKEWMQAKQNFNVPSSSFCCPHSLATPNPIRWPQKTGWQKNKRNITPESIDCLIILHRSFIMPILPSIHLNSLSDDEFATIDKIVMRCAYAVHNKFGRFFDERIYESDLAARLRAEGFDVQTQVPILVTHGNFKKTYFLDLIVNHMLYELKTASTLTSDHEAQALHYAMLQNVRLVKLINFGERQVIGKLLSNALYERERYNFILKTQNMRFFTRHCERLVDYLKKLIYDWGTHLSKRLYNQALVDHFGGEAHCVHRIEIEND
jgi:GxxExxY protein